MNQTLSFIADFADQSITIPLSIVVFVFLLNNIRIARIWAITIIAMMIVLVSMKTLGYVFENHIPTFINAKSISAHTAAGAVVYGGIFTLLVRREHLNIKIAITSSFLFGVFFGTAKYLRGDHTLLEVIGGLILGVSLSTMFTYYANKQTRTILKINRLAISFASLIVIILLHGSDLGGEYMIRDIGRDIRQQIKNN